MHLNLAATLKGRASLYPFCRKGHRGTERLMTCLRSHRCWRWSRIPPGTTPPSRRPCHTLDRGPPGQTPFPSPTWEPRFVQMAANASWPQAPISDQEANPDWSEAACDGPPGGAELDASVPQDSEDKVMSLQAARLVAMLRHPGKLIERLDNKIQK
uniref:Uncharacterized protein n=1 Tax=Rousettus aegyptiacus TaxID=9407 RepID=A0A7J8H190_ROUAE|nr:hypothetical protein HJG63_011139 [Rousettus aegyptiacus]